MKWPQSSGFPLHVVGALAPDGEHVEALARLPAGTLSHVRAPQQEDGTLQLAPSVNFIVLEVEGDAPVVEAGRPDGVGVV